jgi:glyoxylase-like metal-dependent hydrolase (beta-lactamase superfamily II)
MNRKIISRIFAMTAVLTIGWAAWTQQQGAPGVRATRPLTMTIAKIKPDLYEIEGGGGNVLAYVTGEGVILVDDKNPGDRFHDAIMEQLKTVTDQPVKYIFNTHYHEDHTGTNNKFPDAQIISTLNSRLNTLGPAWTQAYGSNRVPPREPSARSMPAQVVFTREISVFLGGKEVRARFLGRGHTNGDAVIIFPAVRTIHTGDLVSTTGVTFGPMVDYDGGGSIVELPKTLTEISKLDFDTLVPGHGPVTDKAGLAAYQVRIEKFKDRAAFLIHSGKSKDEVWKVLGDEYSWANTNNLNYQWTLPGMMAELK